MTDLENRLEWLQTHRAMIKADLDAALAEIDRLTWRERVGLTEIDRLREAIHLALANKDRTHLGTVRSILADAVNAPKETR